MSNLFQVLLNAGLFPFSLSEMLWDTCISEYLHKDSKLEVSSNRGGFEYFFRKLTHQSYLHGHLGQSGTRYRPQFYKVGLRVEFLFKTDIGYPRDAEVTLFTLANPEHSLRFNTHWSAQPVSALARSEGPRKMSQSPVSRNSNIERRMDRPRAVVGVIRGVA